MCKSYNFRNISKLFLWCEIWQQWVNFWVILRFLKYYNCNFISGCWHGNKKGSCQVQGYKKVLESQNWWTAYVHSLIYSEEGKTLIKKNSCILVKQQKDMQLHNIKRCQVKCLFNVHCIINWLIIICMQCLMTLSILKQKTICYEQCLSHIWSYVLIKWSKNLNCY